MWLREWLAKEAGYYGVGERRDYSGEHVGGERYNSNY